jgi:arabinosaccharide transport system substrate-binding protein
MRFPFGKAPLYLLIVAVASIGVRVAVGRHRPPRPDLLLVTISRVHKKAYEAAIPEFERKYGVKVQIQLADWLPLQTRLQNAMLAGTDVPDLAEAMGEGSLGFFTRGPREDIGLMDLTDRLESEGWTKRVVSSRFAPWSMHGRIYALPHDVHPMMLAYRTDLVEQLGIDVRQLDTWDKFVEVGRRITRDDNGDGVPDRYMILLHAEGSWGLTSLLMQMGGNLFDAEGNVAFDSNEAAQLIAWYIHQFEGPTRIAFDPIDEQIMIKALVDGLIVFFPTPDWRSFNYPELAPQLRGKMALMPMPAWKPGGRRTTVWGGTGLMIMKATKHPDLAWELAKFLYFDPQSLGKRFADTNIIPPLKEAWSLPELQRPDPYYSNQPIGRLYAELAPETPPAYSSAVDRLARRKLDEAYGHALLHWRSHGDDGLDAYIRQELHHSADDVRKMADRINALAKIAEAN